VSAAETSAWSVPEADLAAVVRAESRLPEVWLNPDLAAADGTSLPCPDGWFDDVALAVQVHSLRYHGSPQDWDATVMTDGLLVEHGIVVLGVTPHRLRTDPAAVLRRIVLAHGQAARRPRPAVRATPRGEDGTAN
jgi:hypothetical protein